MENSISRSAPRQGSSPPIGPSLRDVRGSGESSAESCGAEKKLTHAAAHISQLSAAQEEAPRRLRWRLLRLSEGLCPCGG